MVRPSVPICSCCIFFIVSEISLRKCIMSVNKGNSKNSFLPHLLTKIHLLSQTVRKILAPKVQELSFGITNY